MKPDAVASGKTGKIVAHLQQAGLRAPRGAGWCGSPRAQAGAFYAVHRGRPFYAELVEFMTSGPCLPMALERADAVAHLRTVIGATDPAEAAPGTIRKLYAESKGRNAIHASDSDENAAREVGFFFQRGGAGGALGLSVGARWPVGLTSSRCPGYLKRLCCEWTSGTFSAVPSGPTGELEPDDPAFEGLGLELAGPGVGARAAAGHRRRRVPLAGPMSTGSSAASAAAA